MKLKRKELFRMHEGSIHQIILHNQAAMTLQSFQRSQHFCNLLVIEGPGKGLCQSTQPILRRELANNILEHSLEEIERAI